MAYDALGRTSCLGSGSTVGLRAEDLRAAVKKHKRREAENEHQAKLRLSGATIVSTAIDDPAPSPPDGPRWTRFLGPDVQSIAMTQDMTLDLGRRCTCRSGRSCSQRAGSARSASASSGNSRRSRARGERDAAVAASGAQLGVARLSHSQGSCRSRSRRAPRPAAELADVARAQGDPPSDGAPARRGDAQPGRDARRLVHHVSAHAQRGEAQVRRRRHGGRGDGGRARRRGPRGCSCGGSRLG